jgi:gluconolactonase
MKVFADDLAFPEAPVELPDGSWLVVEMSPERGQITRLGADGKSRTRIARTGRPNGLALDRNGAIWVAETQQRALLRMSLDGHYTAVAEQCAGERFLFLNDLAFAPNGDLYLTDSGILLDVVAPGGELNPNWRNLDYDGQVYRIDVRTGTVERLDRALEFANGIAWGPDDCLYVTETLTGNIYRYRSSDGIARGPRETFGNVIERFDPAELKGPDGMKFGADGRLYVAVFGQGDITVLERNGAVSERIQTVGTHPTNLLFASGGRRQFFVTEMSTGALQVYDAPCAGQALWG